MAPKRASSKSDEAAKAALLAKKKGKALVDTTHQEATEDDALARGSATNNPLPKAVSAPAALEDNRNFPQASLHRRARTSSRTAKSLAFQRKSSYSCVPCASRTAISRSKKRSLRPSASVCLHKLRCDR
jgi:hypothetical protein